MILYIGPIAYTVRVIPGLTSEDGKREVDGIMVHMDQECRIRAGQQEDCLAHTLLHEVIHGFDLYLEGNKMPEKTVNRLAFALLAFIRDNPDVIARIQNRTLAEGMDK